MHSWGQPYGTATVGGRGGAEGNIHPCTNARCHSGGITRLSAAFTTVGHLDQDDNGEYSDPERAHHQPGHTMGFPHGGCVLCQHCRPMCAQ